MINQVIFNLPIKDREKSKVFFSEMGLQIDSQLTDENALCFVVSENVVVALLLEPHFRKASLGEVVDASRANEVLIAIGASSREEVDFLVDGAIKAGATELHEPADMETVYGRSFADIDHHKWNIFCMDNQVR